MLGTAPRPRSHRFTGTAATARWCGGSSEDEFRRTEWPLSARSGEREGPIAERWEVEVSLRGDQSLCCGTHLTFPRLRREPLPLRPEGRRGSFQCPSVSRERIIKQYGRGCRIQQVRRTPRFRSSLFVA